MVIYAIDDDSQRLYAIRVRWGGISKYLRVLPRKNWKSVEFLLSTIALFRIPGLDVSAFLLLNSIGKFLGKTLLSIWEEA